MKLFIKTLCVLITALVIASSSMGAEEKPLPEGWIQSMDQRKNAVVYKKRDDLTGSQIKIYPAVLLEQFGADEWLNQKLTSTSAPKGTWLDDLSVIRLTANMAYGRRTFTLQNGQKGTHCYLIRRGAIYTPKLAKYFTKQELIETKIKDIQVYAIGAPVLINKAVELGKKGKTMYIWPIPFPWLF